MSVRPPLPAAVAAIVSLLLLASAPAADGPEGAPILRAAPSEDGRAIVLRDGAGARRFTVEAWRAWARDHLDEAVRGPLAIGPVEFGVDDFDRFGAAAAGPDGERVAFSVTTYAMLTTLSLVGVLEVGTGAIEMVPEPRTGDLETPVWSPDGDRVAYASSSARANGEELRVEALGAPGEGFGLSRQALHAAWRRAGLPVARAVTPDAYRPWFRDLAWAGDRLRFTVDAPGAGRGEPAPPDAEAAPPPWRWSVGADGDDLRPEGPASGTP